MSQQSSQARASVTYYAPQPEEKKVEKEQEEQEVNYNSLEEALTS
tara:strand:- start:279 stop:413 length:135 start_codon:yes stop_codon:yes gene_type:complete